MWRNVCLLGAVLQAVVARTSEVIYGLRGEADYRYVTLTWEYPARLAGLNGFQINYCELQAWGPNRCRTKFVDANSGMPFIGDTEFHTSTVIISGLRMATNYSFEVLPRESRHTRLYLQRWMPDPAAKTIVITTKGFSARASLCLPDVSEVEVATGPYFSGRIAVEPSADTHQCLVDGDGRSPNSTYILRIDHKLCGSKVNRTAVETFILVQENLPILTHSTRRFLVLCTFQPETLTVRAGLSLPSSSTGVSSPDVPAVVDEVLDNDVHASALQLPHELGRVHAEQVSEAQMVLVTVIVVVGLVAIGLTVWWFIPIKSRSSRSSILSDDTAYTSNSTDYENFENSLRDSALDFETVEDINEEDLEENVLREGVCNEVLQETCASLVLESVHIHALEAEVATQSEA